MNGKCPSAGRVTASATGGRPSGSRIGGAWIDESRGQSTQPTNEEHMPIETHGTDRTSALGSFESRDELPMADSGQERSDTDEAANREYRG